MTEDRFEHRGYTVIWTGWKPYYDNELLIAQWVAQKDGVEGRLHVCLPFGSCTWHLSGDKFDIKPIDNWLVQNTLVDLFTPEEVKESWKETGRNRMIELVDYWIDKMKQKPPKKKFKDSYEQIYPSSMSTYTLTTSSTGWSPYGTLLTPPSGSYTTISTYDVNTYTTGGTFR